MKFLNRSKTELLQNELDVDEELSHQKYDYNHSTIQKIKQVNINFFQKFEFVVNNKNWKKLEDQNKTLQIKLQSTHEKDDLIKLLQTEMEQLNNDK